ncbi:peptidoglycan-binding protein [Archangium primigenium]|uniref:peptidoglycan-binding protein n=1 Tax=[Archangium] primigenium TaxID=2792470 RepID=UPI0019578A02|nr:peptidoglycan-binding protein [Archangium primigenium]MBM7112782.1 C39 family peptidase [Archangium primigenium]
MSYRIAKSLDQLLAELNALSPKRDKLSDGWIGDAAHASRDSDHNPWVQDAGKGVVTARDFTHDPGNGADMDAFVAQLVKRQDPRIKYIIWNRQIWRSYAKPKLAAWAPTRYTGANAHTKHAHVSVSSEKSLYDSVASWGLTKITSKPGAAPVVPSLPVAKSTPKAQHKPSGFEPYKDGIALGSRNIKEGSAGNDVKWVQTVLRVRADGLFGQITEATVVEWQRAHHLTPDGIVGPNTWKALKALKAPASPGGTQPSVAPSTPAGSGAFVKNGRSFPVRDGYPLYAQGNNSTTGKLETWGNIVIASDSGQNVSQIGCAMTAVTMALSGITGRAITPDEMAQFMKKKGGFTSGGSIKDWDLMGTLVSPPVDLYRIFEAKSDKIDAELKAGRPVVVHVDYYTKTDSGRSGKHDKKGDHWVLVTSRTQEGDYLAHDPAGGRMMGLHRLADGRLEGDVVTKYGTKYVTVGNAVTFSRGPAVHTPESRPAQTPPVDVTPPLVASGFPNRTGSTPGTKVAGTKAAGDKVALPTFAGADRSGTVRAIRDECVRQGVTMAAQIAYVLATVQHETGNTFKPLREAEYLGSKAEAHRKNNLRYYPYYGRGYVQLTWNYNYEKYSKLLGMDLLKNPDLVLRPDISLFILVHGMRTGSFSGKKLSAYINGSRVDFRGARAVVNGSNCAEIIAAHARDWLRSLELRNVA